MLLMGQNFLFLATKWPLKIAPNFPILADSWKRQFSSRKFDKPFFWKPLSNLSYTFIEHYLLMSLTPKSLNLTTILVNKMQRHACFFVIELIFRHFTFRLPLSSCCSDCSTFLVVSQSGVRERSARSAPTNSESQTGNTTGEESEFLKSLLLGTNAPFNFWICFSVCVCSSRHCGRLLCNKCSSKEMPILKFDLSKPVRVCETCSDVLTVGVPPS